MYTLENTETKFSNKTSIHKCFEKYTKLSNKTNKTYLGETNKTFQQEPEPESDG